MIPSSSIYVLENGCILSFLTCTWCFINMTWVGWNSSRISHLQSVLFPNKSKKTVPFSISEEPEGHEKASPVHILKKLSLQRNILKSKNGPFSFCEELWPFSAGSPIVDTADNVFIHFNEEGIWQQNLHWHWHANRAGTYFLYMTIGKMIHIRNCQKWVKKAHHKTLHSECLK